MTTIINGIELDDDWISNQSSLFGKWGKDSHSSRIMIEVWLISYLNPSRWRTTIYHRDIEKLIDDFYNEDHYNKVFNSGEEAKLYIDIFINKYNKLKVFI